MDTRNSFVRLKHPFRKARGRKPYRTLATLCGTIYLNPLIKRIIQTLLNIM